jgi:hypothetical protein
MGSCASDFGLTGFWWVIYSAWFCIASVPVVILYCVGCWVIWCTMDAWMQKEALMAEFEVLFLHFNKGNCGHHEEFICRLLAWPRFVPDTRIWSKNASCRLWPWVCRFLFWNTIDRYDLGRARGRMFLLPFEKCPLFVGLRELGKMFSSRLEFLRITNGVRLVRLFFKGI